MFTITQLREKIVTLLDEDAGIINTAENQKRKLSDGEKSRSVQIFDECEDLEADIGRMERSEAFRKRQEESQHEPIKPDPDDDGQERSRYIPPAAKPVARSEDLFPTFGQQLRAVHAADTGGHFDKRLITRASGLSEGVPSDGGFLVQVDASTDLFHRIYETGILAAKCRRFPISANSNRFSIPAINETSRANGSRWGGVQVYRKNEGVVATTSQPDFALIEMSLEKLIAAVQATDELISDAALLEAYITMAITEEFGFKMDDEIINGSGVGQMLGIMNSAALVTVDAVVGQPAKTINLENIVTMWSRMWAKSRLNSAWYINQDIEPQLNQLSMVIGTGGAPVYMPPGGVADTPYARLYGRPVIPIEQCQTLGTTGDIILADFKQYALIEKDGLKTASSMHVKFLEDEMTYRFTMRNNGQSLWSSALEPFKGGATKTLSPWVVLATR